MALNVIVKNTSGARFEMDIPLLDETVGAFKVRLASASGIPASSQRLIFRGHILKDTQTFTDIKEKHGLESGQSMHVVPSPSGSASRNAPTAAPSTPAAQQPANGGAAPTASGFPGIGGGGGGGAGGLPDMMEMHAQMMRNPEQIQAMMNSPIMESIMSNPQVARNLMMANPQVRELMERNPEFAHVFNDPATFRQMMQMARNPSLMNEMMRNTDRQMANIEMMPGGFDALRRMHENIQAPLMDATAQGGLMGSTNPRNEAAGGDENPFSSLFQQQNTPSNAPMPNPWAPNTPAATQAAQNAAPRSRSMPSAPRTGVAGGSNAGGNTNAFAQLFQGFGGGAGGAASGSNAAGAPGAAPGANGGFPGPGMQMPGLPNGMGAENMMQLLEDPTMQQVMQNILSDPQMLQTMLSADPQLQARMQNSPETTRMLQNPEMMRAFLNPEVMRSVRQLQAAMGNAMNSGASGNAAAATATSDQNPAGAAPQPTPTVTPNPGTNTANPMNDFMAMMNAMATTGVNPTAAPAPEMSQEQLEELYSSQLDQLRDMGFLDKSMCLQALQQSRGNVSAAIENLLSRFGG